jgi:hypothetical protein
MKLTCFIFLTLISSGVSFCQLTNIQSNYDTSKIVVLYKYHGGDSASLDDKDFIVIDSLFLNCLRDHNKNLDSNSLMFLKPPIYFRQYLPFYAKDEKIVYINCFCASANHFPAWKKELIEVFDGGGCFFNLVINLSRKKYMDLRINGFP